MIVLRITDPDTSKIEKIATLLLKERLALDIEIRQDVERYTYKRQKLTSNKIAVLEAKTKALLFTAIDKRIHEEFPEDPPDVYSLPIVNMSWERTQYLKRVLKSV